MKPEANLSLVCGRTIAAHLLMLVATLSAGPVAAQDAAALAKASQNPVADVITT
jgi:hypothetical protein